LKTLAILAPDFLPSSTPPALRVRLFANHLPEFGWQPIIITTDSQYYQWQYDAENKSLLAKDVEIILTSAIKYKNARRLGIGDIGLRSLWFHWQAINQLSQERQIDAVLIPVPPFFNMLLAQAITTKLKIPCLIDYIDPWVSNYYRDLPNHKKSLKLWLADQLSRFLEPIALKNVHTLISVNADYIADIPTRCPWIKSQNIFSIPYGGEPSDFELIREYPRANPIFQPKSEIRHWVYVGRGGEDMKPILGVLFQAFRECLAIQPLLFGNIHLHFIGTSYNPNGKDDFQVLPIAKEVGIEKNVFEHPLRVAYLDALQILSDADSLLIIGSIYSYYTASKIFPYILAEKPLLAIFHENSSAVAILKATTNCDPITFSDLSDLAAQSQKIKSNLLKLAYKQYPAKTNYNKFEQFSAKQMTKLLVNTLQNLSI
jgi:hypothetical protein